MSKSTNLPPIPTETEHDAIYQKVDMGLVVDLLCVPGTHDYQIDPRHREAVCRRCGQGFRYLIHEVEIKDGKLFDLEGNPIA